MKRASPLARHGFSMAFRKDGALPDPAEMTLRPFDILTRTIAIVSVCGLTWLLLAPNPWAFVDLLLGRLPVDDAPRGGSDKFHHVLGYLALTLTFLLVTLPRGRHAAVTACGLSAAHALLTECLQQLFPPRTTDPADLLADAAGIVMAVGIVLGLKQVMPSPPGPEMPARSASSAEKGWT